MIIHICQTSVLVQHQNCVVTNLVAWQQGTYQCKQQSWVTPLNMKDKEKSEYKHMVSNNNNEQSITGHNRLHMTIAQITEIQLCIQNTRTCNGILVATVKVKLKGAGTQLSYQPWSKTFFHFVRTMTPIFNSSAGMFMQTVHKIIYVKITNHFFFLSCNIPVVYII